MLLLRVIGTVSVHSCGNFSWGADYAIQLNYWPSDRKVFKINSLVWVRAFKM